MADVDKTIYNVLDDIIEKEGINILCNQKGKLKIICKPEMNEIIKCVKQKLSKDEKTKRIIYGATNEISKVWETYSNQYEGTMYFTPTYDMKRGKEELYDLLKKNLKSKNFYDPDEKISQDEKQGLVYVMVSLVKE